MANPDGNKKGAGSSMRSLGRVAATLMTASFVIGTGIFGALGATAERAGDALLLAMNPFGVGFTSKVLIGTVTSVIMLLGVVVAFSLPHVDAANLVPTFDKGPVGFMVGAAIFFWAWDGFMRTAIMAGEIKDPRRTISIAIIGGIAVAAVVFLVVAATTLGVLGPESMGRDDVPLFRAATQAVGTWGGWVS